MILMVLTLVLLGALFYLPVYFPFVLSFKVKHAAMRTALRVSSLATLALAFIPPPGLRSDKTGDIAGSFEAAIHNIPILVAWVWGGGLVLHSIGVAVARRQMRKDR